jgi:hypothetical protein
MSWLGPGKALRILERASRIAAPEAQETLRDVESERPGGTVAGTPLFLARHA